MGLELAQAKNCVACHRIDMTQGRKRLGPDFEIVSKRYQGSAAAINYLAGRIRNGSRGSWGAIPMPAQVQVSQPDAETLAAWVLSLSGDRPVGASNGNPVGNTSAVPTESTQ